MDTYYKPIQSAAVLGAGTMGAQIAAHLANAGIKVHLLDLPSKEGPRHALVQQNLKTAIHARPSPFFSECTVESITTGNFEDDFGCIADVDWIIEAVAERLDIKRQLMARIEEHARQDAIVSTNTSGIPIRDIVSGRGAAFRKRMLGTHFFNPPRYLELLELVPTADTDAATVARIASFGRINLGKGIVVARDVPYFIGNRIGIYSMLGAMSFYTSGQYTIAEIDTLTGPLVGRPKSGTFRTADLVGLDVLVHIGQLLYEALTDDESRERFKVPVAITELVARGALGAKSGAGFYRKEGRKILSLNLEQDCYEEAAPLALGNLKPVRKAGGLKDRLQALYVETGRAGAFFRATTLDTLGYAARRLGEIADSPVDIDRAMRWGFGWPIGPFQLWDMLRFDRVRRDMEARGIALPAWASALPLSASFYREQEVFLPGSGVFKEVKTPSDEIRLASVRARPNAQLWSNNEAGMLDLGDGVALFEFRSKANTLGTQVIGGLMEAIGHVENDPSLRGLVIGNEGRHFSVGANLKEMVHALEAGKLDIIDAYIATFQQAMQRVRYAAKPVVVAVHQRALGGGCELVMASPHPVAAAESYMGLVEVGVGLIPAGTGCMRLAAAASALNPGHDSNLLALLTPRFEQVARGAIAGSATQAKEMGYLPTHAPVVMRSNRRIHVAKWQVINLSEQGYVPPRPADVRVLGKPGFAAMKIGIHQLLKGGFASGYDRHLAERVAFVMTGGELSGAQKVTEQYLLNLERVEFMKLLANEKSQQRISGMLAGKPVRN